MIKQQNIMKKRKARRSQPTNNRSFGWVWINLILICCMFGLAKLSAVAPTPAAANDLASREVHQVNWENNDYLKEPDLVKLSSEAFVLMDGESGEIVVEKQGHKTVQPASTTKILTAITAINSGSVDQRVKISSRAAATGEASLNLKEDEVLSLEQLLYGALIKSGNDACVAIAEGLAPSEEEFVARMNFKALSIGALQTNFKNTNGLPDSNHLTTAYDLAVMTRYALQDPLFSDIVRTKEYQMSWEVPHKTLHLKNTNLLLQMDSRIIGVKTGTTSAAGKCLVSAIELDDRVLIGVVLDSKDRYKDMQALFNWGEKQINSIN